MQKNILFPILAILSGVLIVILMGFGNKNEVSVKYVNENKGKIVLIDVREPEELKTDGYIEGSTNIPMNILPSSLSNVPKDKQVVVYCRSGRRSAVSANQLSQLGYTNVKTMAGGINAWKGAGLPVKY